jgi:hypothetical protein
MPKLPIWDAFCPECLKEHSLCGFLSRQRPWSIRPRCVECGAALLLPADLSPPEKRFDGPLDVVS